MGTDRLAGGDDVRALTFLLLVLLVAGCTTTRPPATTSTTPTSTVATAPPLADPTTNVSLVEVDGRWDFPEAPARALVGGPGAGALWLGEARVAAEPNASAPAIAGSVLAYDANA